MRYVEFMKRVVPLHDDLFDFFYEAMPGYEQVGKRRILLGCWGAFQDPDVCNFQYKDMTNWGRAMCVTPGVVVDGKLVTNDLVDINLGIRILLGSSYYDDWEDQEMFVTKDPLGNPVDRSHPVEPDTRSRSRRSATSTTSTAGSCRRAGSTARTTWRSTPAAARSRACGRRRCRVWSTSAATSRPPARACRSTCRRRALKGPVALRVEDPEVVEHASSATARAPTSRPTPPPPRCTSSRRRWRRSAPARTKTWEPFKVPDEAIGCGFTEAVRGVLSHHMVIRDGKIANYHPYPPTPWNANPRDIYGTPGPVRGRRAGHARSSRRTTSSTSRASTSCAPCAASTRACRAACTCTWARARCSKKVHSPTQCRQHSSGSSAGASTRRPSSDLRAIGDAHRAHARGARRPRSIRASASRSRSSLQLVTELYGAGLGRIMELVAAPRTRTLRRRGSPPTSSLASLLVAPRPAPRRPRRAGRSGRSTRCARSSPATAATSSCSTSTSGVGAVRLRLLGSCDGCPSSAVTLQHDGRDEPILEAAPGDRDHRRRAAVRPPSPTPIALGTKPAHAFDPATGCAAAVDGPERRRAARRRSRRAQRIRDMPCARPRPASGASCAPSRSPTSTATSSISRRAR